VSDPHVNAARIRVTLNATLALAAHHGVILDQDGHTVALPDGEHLVTTVARVLFARHAADSLSRWEDRDVTSHAWWKGRADAVIDVATTTTLVLARTIHAGISLGSWDRLTSGEAAHYLITAEHVARIITQRTQRDLERAQAEASRTTGCPVCGATRLTAKCVREQHGVVETGA